MALLLLAALGATRGASTDIVLSRYEHGSAGARHRDTIRCHTAATGHHGSLETLVEDFVLADTIWCADVAPGATCTDETSRAVYRLMTIECRDGVRKCAATLDCYEIVFKRFWGGLVTTLVATVLLVAAVRYVEHRTALRQSKTL